jgi:acylphosphatase
MKMKNIDNIQEEERFNVVANEKVVGHVTVKPWGTEEQNKILGNFLPNGVTTCSVDEIEARIREKATKEYHEFEIKYQ